MLVGPQLSAAGPAISHAAITNGDDGAAIHDGGLCLGPIHSDDLYRRDDPIYARGHA